MSDTVFAFDPGEREYWMHMLISNMASARYYHPPIPLYSSLRVTWPASTPLSFYPYLSIYIYIYTYYARIGYIYTFYFDFPIQTPSKLDDPGFRVYRVY